ncbi:MAG: phosphoribosylformylglycinamidine synthase subunit PurL [Planctomycetes bacterium]|nr:phosphoribosylformylglycinamidine synthase subunit PurL [Planctomycetota bacterium]
MDSSESPGGSAVCIEIAIRPGRRDVLAARLLESAREAGLGLPDGLATRRGYSLRILGGLPAAERLARDLLADPVLHETRVYAPESPPAEPDTLRLEVVRRPGVMDPAAQSVVRAAARLGITVRDVRTWAAYVLPGSVDRALAGRLGRELLANDVVEEVRVAPAQGVAPAQAGRPAEFRLVHVPLREADDEGLLALSRDGCLALDLVEMKAVQKHFAGEGRDPTDIELETLAQTWSEHCKHKTLTGKVELDGETIDNLLKSTIARATRELDRDFCKSVFVDNAGVVAFDDAFHLTFKVETHNHPSALEPYGGAGTGLGGVLRDTLGTGLGARPVASTDVFCFGPPDLPDDRVPKGCLPPRRIMKGVVAGVRDYGNRMGIPTVSGAVCFDERYVANPLVYCGSIGLLPVDRLEKKADPGDLIVVCGGATGRDGIHGATFSSLELHDESESVSSGAVQIGNAIEEKRLLDVQLMARDRGLYSCVTDCGAGGLSSAVGEMAESSGGAHVVLDRVPLKYDGLTYPEIWISEAQERMVLAVPKAHEAELLALFAAEDVPATVIGEFTGDGRLTAEYAGTRVMDLSLEFVHDGLPRQTRRAERRPRALTPVPALPRGECGAMLETILGMPNVASKAWIVRQYDHEVQAGSVVKPLLGVTRDGPSDAAVCAPVLGSKRAFAVGCGINPCLGDVDPYQMTLHAIDEALRNVVAVGGDPSQTSILDNFSWGRCDKPENLADLVDACRACYDGAMAYRTPFISGKDSLNNDYRVGDESRSIPPTLLISALSILDDLSVATTMDAKAPEHALLIVGVTGPELGGSHLARALGATGEAVPPVDLERAPRILSAVNDLIREGLVHACHDLSEGGLAVAAAEMAFAGGLGAELDVTKLPVRGEVDATARLFGESPTRLLLEVAPDVLDAVEALLDGVPWARLGKTTSEPRLRVRDGSGVLIDLPTERLHAAYAKTLDLDGEQVHR